MPKRSSSTPAAAAAKKSKTAAPKNDDNNTETSAVSTLPLNQWRVVLTGDFVVKPRPVLEQALKAKGVAVTAAVSGKTTHLLLGQSGVNEYGKQTGMGSSKYQQAVAKKLPILSEPEVWAVLTGSLNETELQSKKAAQKVNKPGKTAPLTQKIVYALQESGHAKLSLVKLKNELADRFDLNFENTRSKNALKKALSTLLEEHQLEQTGASYALPTVVSADSVAALVGERTAEEQEVTRTSKIKKLCPTVGRWRGLRVVSQQVSKTGRARCKCCGELIAKGETQAQVMDDSLFKMVIFPGDCHEGVSRGYTEEDFGQDYTIARQKFYIHETCQTAADEKFQAIFQKEWKKIQPQVLQQRSDDFDE